MVGAVRRKGGTCRPGTIEFQQDRMDTPGWAGVYLGGRKFWRVRGKWSRLVGGELSRSIRVSPMNWSWGP